MRRRWITCCNFNKDQKKRKKEKRNCLVSWALLQPMKCHSCTQLVSSSLQCSAVFKTRKMQHLMANLDIKIAGEDRNSVTTQAWFNTYSLHRAALMPVASKWTADVFTQANIRLMMMHFQHAALSRRPWGVYADCHLFYHDLYLTEPEPEVVLRIWF